MTFPTPIDKHLSSAEKFNRASNLAKRGGNSGDVPPTGFEARLAKVEASVEHIGSDVREIRADIRELRTDIKDLARKGELNFRLLFGVIITASLGFLAVIARGFGWL